jgi:ubiquinone/menaquinone biosynthesis C-methylase UbiE
MKSAANFDRLVDVYRGLELLAFGHDLERARFVHLDILREAESILVLGEGDGRALERLVNLAPRARIHCVDASEAMLARSRQRLGSSSAISRVHWEQADIFALRLAPQRYDAVITFFFLDCFDHAGVEEIVRNVTDALQPEALWLFADFVLPAGRIARLRARVWLAVLYAFFRWQTGLRVQHLPPSESIMSSAGFRPVSVRDFQHGLVRSSVFVRSARPPDPA